MSGIDLIQDLGLVMLIAAGAAWLCQRIGLPVVIGYLGAGILISPHTHSFGFISDADRVNALAQIGLVFLIFSIGQGLKLQRVKRVGLPLIAGTLLTAIFVFVGCRWLATLLGWPSEHGLVFAAMLMVSSTAILGKTLRESKATHTSFGQTALTVTALDDLVAIVMLTVLASMIQAGSTEAGSLFGTVVRLKAAIITMIVGALLLIPPLLKHLNRSASSEVGGLAIAGLLLGMALLSAKAGFSAALGAFLLGTVVSTTGRNEQVGRVMTGLSDVFGPVFFVAMGMLFDYAILANIWPMVLAVFVLAVALRMVAATVALLMVGHSMNDAIRAALSLTAIGEFSLILALAGVQGGLVPDYFYAVAVGVCLLTAMSTPVLIRHSAAISAWLEARLPGFSFQWVGLYHTWIESLRQRQQSSFLWRVSAPRVVQVTITVLFVSGLLIFASPLYRWTEKWLRSDLPLSSTMLPLIFWTGFGLLVIAPLIAFWRQVESLAMIAADSATKGTARRSLLQPVFATLLKAVVSVAALAWFATLIPYDVLPAWAMAAVAAVLISVGVAFWRSLIRLQSRFEIELRAQLSDSPFAADKPQLPGWPKRNGHSKMSLREVIVRDQTEAVGRSIAELALRKRFGSTIVSIDRQGVPISNPDANTILYPSDKILLLGTDESLEEAEHWLCREPESNKEVSEEPTLGATSLSHLIVPATFRHLGKSLADLALKSRFGVQIVGIERGAKSVLSPGPSESLEPGDQLLVLGRPHQVTEAAFWLAA